ncbi:MAG: DedA family protein [Acidobacteriota bacterium]|nr:DedA family protein [Acidobacteriota bacterium]MDR0843304.1 DedA family protein [Acidobacteriota bacterium]
MKKIGYPGVFLLMTMESMVFPVPSEAVMPFAGFLIAEGKLTWIGVIVASTCGSIIGSLVSYFMGAWGGKPFIDRFGKYLLLDREDLALTERFFGRYGSATIFVSRFIPVVRHLISIPAGTGRMPLLPFTVYTVIGAAMWNAVLTVIGYYLKQNWAEVMEYSHTIDIVVVVFLVAVVAFFAWKHVGRKRAQSTTVQ